MSQLCFIFNQFHFLQTLLLLAVCHLSPFKLHLCKLSFCFTLSALSVSSWNLLFTFQVGFGYSNSSLPMNLVRSIGLFQNISYCFSDRRLWGSRFELERVDLAQQNCFYKLPLAHPSSTADCNYQYLISCLSENIV